MKTKKKNEVKLLPGFFDRGNPAPTFTINGEKCVILHSEPLDEEPVELYWNGFIYSGKTETNLTVETLTDDELSELFDERKMEMDCQYPPIDDSPEVNDLPF